MPMHAVLGRKSLPARHIARLEFLDRYASLASLPSTEDDVTEAGRAALNQAVARMKHAGLYARSTEDADCRWGIRLLVGNLRKQAAG